MKSNKELREEYKQKKFRMGVFQIRNTVNGKVFVGSSPNLEAIWNRHQAELKLGGHRNAQLQQDWKAFGEESFQFEVLSELAQDESQEINYQKELRQLEALFMEELQPFGDRGYHAAKA